MKDYLYKILILLTILRLDNTKIFNLIRKGVKLTINIIYPYYYKLSKNSKGGLSKHLRKQPIIVSLTSFPERIPYVWLTIETILRQKEKPDQIILWLASSQFNGFKDLPKRLLEQQKRGLEIRFCEDLRPHKKYYYTVLENPNANVIIVDDDMYYPSDLIKNLVEKSLEFPNTIICTRGHFIKKENGKVAPYKNWIENSFDAKKPTFSLCPTGCGGVLYPPMSLNKEVFNKQAIYELCLNADDLWLKIMSLLNDTKAIKISSNSINFVDIIKSQKTKLTSSNVGGNLNDIQLNNIITKYNFDLKKYVE